MPTFNSNNHHDEIYEIIQGYDAKTRYETGEKLLQLLRAKMSSEDEENLSKKSDGSDHTIIGSPKRKTFYTINDLHDSPLAPERKTSERKRCRSKREERSEEKREERSEEKRDEKMHSNKPAERFRTDILTQIRAADSEYAPSSDEGTLGLRLTDRWREEWSHGVQVLLHPKNLPRFETRPCDVPAHSSGPFRLEHAANRLPGLDLMTMLNLMNEFEIECFQVLKSVDEVIGQLADLEKRGEHSTSQIKQNLEANFSTLAEEWARLVEVLIKMCLESDEAVFVVELLPIFMKYPDFLELFRERMVAIASEFVLGEGEEEGRRLEQVPAFLGSLLCARWPRGMHRDTLESNPVLFTAFEIVRGWMLVVQEASEGERDGRRAERRERRERTVEEKERVAAELTEAITDRLMNELEKEVEGEIRGKIEQTALDVLGEWERRKGGGGEGRECSICDLRHGACIQCDFEGCAVSFHTTCAQRSGVCEVFPQSIVIGPNETEVAFRAYCKRHTQQRKMEKQGKRGGRKEMIEQSEDETDERSEQLRGLERAFFLHVKFEDAAKKMGNTQSVPEVTAALLPRREAAGGPGKTTTTASDGVSQTGAEGETGATESQQPSTDSKNPQKPKTSATEPVIDQAGLDPGVWREVLPEPPIRECRLTPEEKTKFRGHLDRIFGADALLGKRLKKPYLYSQNDVVAHDTMWSDPAKGLHGTTYNNDRGTSVLYGLDELAYALDNMECVVFFRGHTRPADEQEVDGEVDGRKHQGGCSSAPSTSTKVHSVCCKGVESTGELCCVCRVEIFKNEYYVRLLSCRHLAHYECVVKKMKLKNPYAQCGMKMNKSFESDV